MDNELGPYYCLKNQANALKTNSIHVTQRSTVRKGFSKCHEMTNSQTGPIYEQQFKLLPSN
ncbi:hypothetical protein T01_11884 [Trichinella spiralis]|uniref:Uncharacterized protein n=1 Tax=Trichinella spiralis TaxID=6334 RepID=A0A0V1BW48_TRISP|nr:hypothetical protein T01_11884 [Trichinella spiralis]